MNIKKRLLVTFLLLLILPLLMFFLIIFIGRRAFGDGDGPFFLLHPEGMVQVTFLQAVLTLVLIIAMTDLILIIWQHLGIEDILRILGDIDHQGHHGTALDLDAKRVASLHAHQAAAFLNGHSIEFRTARVARLIHIGYGLGNTDES